MALRATLGLTAGALLAAAVAGCRGASPPRVDARPEMASAAGAGVRDEGSRRAIAGDVDTVWYISIRRLEGGRDTRSLDSVLHFGLALYRRREVVASRTTLEDPALLDSVALTREAFLAALTDRLGARPPVSTDDTGSAAVPAILYVHGFGTSRREAWHHTATAQALATSEAPWVVFCWPSNGLGLDWPRPSQLITRAYHDDVAHADASRPALAETLALLVGAIGSDRVVVTSHSLGARLVAGVLADSGSAVATVLTGAPLRATAFITPDIEAAAFADTLVPALLPRVARVVLYVSARDRALRLARRIHGTDRAGLVADPPLVRATFETVDISGAATTESWWQRHFGNHHAIRYAAGALSDLAHLVAPLLSPWCRSYLGTGTRSEDGVWHLHDGPHPEADARQRCARTFPRITGEPSVGVGAVGQAPSPHLRRRS